MIPIPRCTACNTPAYPPRLLCPACGAASWQDQPCEAGTVEQCTTVSGPPPVTLASIRLPPGPVLVAALPAPAPPGTVVHLRPGPGRSVLATPAPGCRPSEGSSTLPGFAAPQHDRSKPR